MTWILPYGRTLESYGADINIYAKGLVRPNKCPGYKKLGFIKKKRHLTLVVCNSKKGNK
jgi:hypothetical protein